MNVTIDVRADETILAGALRAGLGVSFGCSVGDCGACKAALLSGSVMQLESIKSTTLSSQERDLGTILTCAAVPRTAITLALLPDDEFRFHPQRTVERRITGQRNLGGRLFEVDLEAVIDEPIFEYSAGQFALLDDGSGAHRQAFFAESRTEKAMQILLQYPPDRRVGDTVELRGPYGSAYLRERFGGPIVMAAADFGRAAIFAVLDKLARRRPTRELKLFLDLDDEVSNRIAYAWHRQPQLQILPTNEIPQMTSSLSDWSAYIFGPSPFVRAASHEFTRRGVDAHNLHREMTP